MSKLNRGTLSLLIGSPLPALHGPSSLSGRIKSYSRAGGRRGWVRCFSDKNAAAIPYTDLVARANKLASGIRHRGGGPGTKILLHVGEQYDFITGLLACIFAGTVAVPWQFINDPRDARAISRLKEVVAANPEIWVLCNYDGSGAPLLPPGVSFKSHILKCDETETEAETAWPETTLNDVVLRLYTSGSTGTPKAIDITNRNLLGMLIPTIAEYGFCSEDVALNWMPMEHVGAIVPKCILPLLVDASQAHIATRDIIAKPSMLFELISRHRATIAWAPSFAYKILAAALSEAEAHVWDLSSLRFFVNAGEIINACDVRSFVSAAARFNFSPRAIRPAFGMSETCSGITWGEGIVSSVANGIEHVCLGKPIPGAQVRVVDGEDRVVEQDCLGRVQVCGLSVCVDGQAGVSRDWDKQFSATWFDTGDMGFIRDEGLYVVGRTKSVVIVNGQNYAAAEIEMAAEKGDELVAGCSAAISVRDQSSTNEVWGIFYVRRLGCSWTDDAIADVVRARIATALRIVPHFCVSLTEEEMPRTGIGKIERGTLKERYMRGMYQSKASLASSLHRETPSSGISLGRGEVAHAVQEKVSAIWSRVLAKENIDWRTNFFEIGGDSITAVTLAAQLSEHFNAALSPIDVFSYPTIVAQSQFLSKADVVPRSVAAVAEQFAVARDHQQEPIAIIGIACRFPGAENPEELWNCLLKQNIARTIFSEEQLTRSGIPRELFQSEKYVRAGYTLGRVEYFDAQLFGITPQDARIMDPQHRVFLEIAWECLERAGYAPRDVERNIGVFAGAGMNTYLINNILRSKEYEQFQRDPFLLDTPVGFNLMVANDKDYLPLRVAYSLNLTGPAVCVQSACSTSLVAVDIACTSLHQGKCEMAFAGGVSIKVPEETGHLHEAGLITSADGFSNAFSRNATGTVFSNGAGIVLLKKLSKAKSDGDNIVAVIRGTATNNDGRSKVGFTAPCKQGQVDVIEKALHSAGVPSEKVSFIEAHGTATRIGDPIELSALAEGYNRAAQKPCMLGALKSNIGHPQIASGIAGLIKAALVLSHRLIPGHPLELPPETENELSKYNLALSREKQALSADGEIYAGVNSLGIGGTNAHVILSGSASQTLHAEATNSRNALVLTISGQSEESLEELIRRYINYLSAADESDMARICITSNLGRAHLKCRRAIVGGTVGAIHEGLSKLLTHPGPRATSRTLVMSENLQDEYAILAKRGDILAVSAIKAVLRECTVAFETDPEPFISGANVGNPPFATLVRGLALFRVLQVAGITFDAVEYDHENALLAEYLSGLYDLRAIRGRMADSKGESTFPGKRRRDLRKPAAGASDSQYSLKLTLSGGIEDFQEYLRSSYESGDSLNWSKVLEGHGRRKIALPTYPFDRIKHWIYPANERATKPVGPTPTIRTANLSGTSVMAVLSSGLEQVLGIQRQQIEAESGFAEMGMDSVKVVEFKNYLEMHLGRELQEAIFYSHYNIALLAQYLTETQVRKE